MEIQLESRGAHLEARNWEKFDVSNSQIYMSNKWYYSIYFTIAYVVLIHLGQHVMKNQRPLKLKTPLLCWNLLLAAFSIMGFIRSFPELYSLLVQEDGFYKSVCSRENQTIATAFWSLAMAWSKVAELFDTAFIVLRKSPLIFLHWYHHFTVMCFTFFTYSDIDPSNRWMMSMNFFIHGIMYSYYAAKAVGIKIPRSFSMVITTLQLSQMIMGMTINLYYYVQKANGVSCDRRDINVLLGLLMYFSYMILFGNFFLKSYVLKKTKKA